MAAPKSNPVEWGYLPDGSRIDLRNVANLTPLAQAEVIVYTESGVPVRPFRDPDTAPHIEGDRLLLA
jgi:hypothetical protein